MEDIVNQYKSMAIEADERRARPPPEPPPWSASESRVWKKMKNYVLILFYSVCVFHLNCMLFWTCSYFLAEILEFKSSDDKSGLPVVGSVKPITGLANIIASTKVIDNRLFIILFPAFS
ncbi:unnamed protein product, partial [Cuscuta epithymum]